MILILGSLYLFRTTNRMSYTNTYELYKRLNDENIILSFKGVVTADLLTSVLHIMESRLSSIDESPRIKKKVFNVLVECMQNLYHHTDAKLPNAAVNETEANSALLVIVKEKDGFVIKTGNFIDNNRILELRDRLLSINKMDKVELKALYRENLSHASISSKGTAGLGMIDIARKSGNKLDFEFLEVDKESSFFCLNVKID